MMTEAKHVSVLLNECIENLNIKPGGVYLDGPLGLGGHSYQIASRLTTGRLICIDRDETAIERAGKRLAPFEDKVTLVHGNFSDAAQIIDSLGIPGVDGMLFDLGVSSPQLDEIQRGFSYMGDAPLDMRMDAGDSLTAYEVVNTWPEERLNRILWDYGEERYARRISRAILEHRAKSLLPPLWNWWISSRAPCLPLPCGRSSTRPSAASRPSASPSMMSWGPSPK